MLQPIVVDSAPFWDTLKSEWRERGIEKLRAKLIEAGLISDTPLLQPEKTLDSPHGAPSSDSKHQAPLRVDLKSEATWRRAFETNGGTTLLAYFVFMWGMRMWEYTSNREDVRDSVADARTGYLNAFRTANEIVRENDPAPNVKRDKLRHYLNVEQELVYFIFTSFTIPVNLNPAETEDKVAVTMSGALLLDAMSVESAVYGGSVTATQKRASAVIGLCDDVLGDNFIEGDGIRGLLREVLEVHREYYGCIAQAAKAMEGAANATPDTIDEAVGVLKSAIKKMEDARENLVDEVYGEDVYASELPAYLAALRAWRDRLNSWQAGLNSHTPPSPVCLDSVNITYIYPFALPREAGLPKEAKEAGVQGEQCGAQVMAYEYGRSTDSTAHPRLGGLTPSKSEQMPLTDMWTWGGRKKPLNTTVSLEMPELSVELPDDDAATCKYNIEIRFNELGNHYMRVDLELPQPDEPEQKHGPPTLNAINQALQRATPYSGEQVVTSANGKAWATIADYAENVINDVAVWITGDQKDDAIRLCGFNKDHDYHVVIVINAASVLERGSRRDATIAEIEETYGSVLMQLLNRESTTLDEWICWRKPEVMYNLLGDACFPSDFAAGTGATTVLYMPSTPSWAQSGYVEVAEFAASFSPLVRQSKNNLDDKLEEADKITGTDKDKDIEVQINRLDQMRADLHKALEEIRKFRTYLVPSQLLSLRAESTFLDHLYKQSRLPRSRRDIDGYLERGRIAIDRMNAREARLHDHQNRKYQEAIQFILFVVGLFSFSGILALGMTLFWGSNVPGYDSDEKATLRISDLPWMEFSIVLGVYLVVAIVAIYFYLRYARRGQGNKKR